MSRKFYNNTEKPLFDLFKGIAQDMANFYAFHAVAGYFRSSGYFKLRELLDDVPEIKILVGINIDDIFRHRNQALIGFSDLEAAKRIFKESFIKDIQDAAYTQEVERGILQMIEDLKSGKLQMRIHSSHNLHAKFYLCLPKNLTDTSDGWVIMGSSNLSDSGLGTTQPPRYELNAALRDIDDVMYCEEEFQKLWLESDTLDADDIVRWKNKTHLGEDQPTPYEIYMKVLIDTFGDQVEDDFTMQLPDEVKDLKYQKDAVVQGYQMLMQHHGLFLADVVGLGKTLVATMIAKRFVEANGKNTNILVVYPPAVEENWKSTFKLFGLTRKTQFITNGSLNKILEGRDQYKDKEDFDLIIVDEAHGFRSETADKYDELQKICKSTCVNEGLLGDTRKKIMLLSATPLNNRPEDLLNLLLLFQNSQTCTIEGIPNLKSYFAPHIDKYRRLMAERGLRDVTKDVDEIYEHIRNEVLDKVTIRRTRNNIENDPDYKADIDKQGIVFPKVLPPTELVYKMNDELRELFYETLDYLTNEELKGHLTYARYRAVEFLLPPYNENYPRAIHMGQMLKGIYRVHMVKRLESSFEAFRKSLDTLYRITCGMIQMFKEDKVIIAPDLNVKGLQDKGIELDAILEYAAGKGYDPKDITFTAGCFDPIFFEKLKNDKQTLEMLRKRWDDAKKFGDPKFELFCRELDKTFMNLSTNREGKLVVFSESVDTLTYLHEHLTNGPLLRNDVLFVHAGNRDKLKETIKKNFDANNAEQENRYSIILTSDVLAEGVNLHRSNVIVNYDSPWNATRLMQRVGRVNRIGSVAPFVYNYMFYPSAEGDREIQLYKNALVKLQGFHSAFGEDAQIYSREEIVKQFELFDSNVKDSIDKKIALLREVRALYNSNRQLYHKIKELPLKSRVARDTGRMSKESIIFLSSNFKTEFYKVSDDAIVPIDFIEAAAILKAKPEERAVEFSTDVQHYEHVRRALAQYTREYVMANDDETAVRVDLDNTSLAAQKFLRLVMQSTQDEKIQDECGLLVRYINEGIYAKLPKLLKSFSDKFRVPNSRGKKELNRALIQQEERAIEARLSQLLEEYRTQSSGQRQMELNVSDPQVIISESFI